MHLNLAPARLIDALPWPVALVGIAAPHLGSGSIYWLILALWLVVLAAIALARPIRSADRATRLTTGVGALVALVFLGSLGGWYLIPAVITWLAVELWRSRDIRRR